MSTDSRLAASPAALVLGVSLLLTACGGGERQDGGVPDTDAAGTAALEGGGPGAAEAPPAAALPGAGVGALLAERFADFGDVRYFEGRTDLDGDGRDEVVVHVAGPIVCGTGGCNTLVFTPEATGDYRQVAEITVSRPPIQVSSRSSNGWRNLLVHVSGGGLGASYDAELEFDGEGYPSNPTVEPVGPAPDTEGAEVLIPEFESFTEGKPIPAP